MYDLTMPYGTLWCVFSLASRGRKKSAKSHPTIFNIVAKWPLIFGQTTEEATKIETRRKINSVKPPVLSMYIKKNYFYPILIACFWIFLKNKEQIFKLIEH
jgi:hypothetical protein